MHSETVLAAYDQQMRRGARADGPGARVERIGNVVRHFGTERDWNGVLWSDLDADTADAAIAEQVAFFGALGVDDFEWKLYSHDRPADLGRRLGAAGFTPRPQEALMVAEIGELATGVNLPAGIHLRPVATAADVDLVVDVHERVFGADGSRLRHRLLAQLAEAPDTVMAVLAMAADQPVCAARLELHAGADFASLWGGGTLPAWRGKGIYRALIAYRAAIAAERGYQYLQVDASDESRPILGRLGFVRLSTTTPYLYQF
ncbi:GNAT family N-acetyltransferase [Streptantibioticus rubrisoli]|uniref:GNAT family N-acetyltransferase n=1 Tax=Streptantibioticus rubrisoli TaxID=1387313 RepID=A0ABT1P689_9ACTN|nr:GNAT family N-acetyltransferase [Streptantibioticus rubrisoli]MCQ4040898.1 GNAT family N-acetyltransferase [Streptantibioticus rubrisoli]